MSKVIAGMFFILTMSTTVCATNFQMRTSMKIQNTSLWQLIDMLGNHPSLVPDKIMQSLPIAFLKRNNNGYFSSYDGGRLSLIDQVDIEAVLLRVRHEDEARGMVSLYLDPSGACVTLDEVHKHYPEVVITDHPRGHSLDEQTYWSIQQPWGELSFGFKERNPECLASVVLDRTPPPAPSPSTTSSP